jgi:transcriptional regulator with XRE-family HTH domain
MTRPNEENTNLAAFGERITLLRRERGYTQTELSQKSGLGVDMIGAIERGRRWARLTTLHKLAKGFDITIEELFRGL